MSISSRVDIDPIKIGSNWTFLMGGWEPESPLSAGRFDILPSVCDPSQNLPKGPPYRKSLCNDLCIVPESVKFVIDQGKNSYLPMYIVTSRDPLHEYLGAFILLSFLDAQSLPKIAHFRQTFTFYRRPSTKSTCP